MFLFSPGSVFRLESIEKFNDQVWYCKLSVNDEDECVLNKLFVHLKNEVVIAATFVTLGVYLSALGKNDTAVEYYRTLLMESTDPDTNATIHNNYAIVYDQKNDQTNASFELKKAQQTYIPNDNESTHQKADTSSNVSERSPDIVLSTPVLSNSQILNHYNLACVYYSDGRFDDALAQCDQALKIITAEQNVDESYVYYAMASICYSQEKFNDASKHFKTALNSALLYLPATNALIEKYLNNIAVLYQKKALLKLC
ncbi:unnamed protein product [Didymodactylos carnosus]|uniref:Uncharacterized protein n=1 Tax=Didymodactylos carnosus TaxID=1234261 RepID=A0A8S2ETM3_9BILA|nr:unnamed protein product [Didymodactylos carnosus]CAF4043418.1 unnamed protein product [Didymodactylos carnosus]